MIPAPEVSSWLRLPVRAVTLVPIQPIDPAALDQISDALRLRGVEVRRRSPMLRPRHSYDARRRQLRADVLLQRVAEVAARPVLGITDADCYAGGLNFVFGIAQVHGGSAVVSLARLRAGAEESTFTSRAMKEIFHELGHAVGLKHCEHRGCVMRFSNSLADTDVKGEELCESCSRLVSR